MTRVFDAPRSLVFDAHTRPELLKSPMEHGVAQSYDKLAELLASPGARGMEKGAGKS